MPLSGRFRAEELHHLAAHLHEAAATAHGKGDHLTAHELTRQALEQSTNVKEFVDRLAHNPEEAGEAHVSPLVETKSSGTTGT